MHLSHLDEAKVYLAQSLELYEDIGDMPMITHTHGRLGLVLLHLGEFESGRRHALTSVALGREVGGMIFAQALSVLALAEEALGNLAAADALFGEGVAYCKAHGLSGYVVSLIGGQAYEAWDLGERQRGRALALEVLRIAVEEHHLLALGMVPPICPLLLLEQGEAVRAAEIYGLEMSGPLWHASKLVAITRKRVYASICAALPPEQIAAVQERGRQLDPWTTAAELLEELTAVGTVTDDDGGSGTATATVVVNYTVVGGGLLPPINQDGSSVFKYGSTIPVKVRLQDCDGSYPANLAPKISLTMFSANTPPFPINEPISTSAADTTGVMRYDASNQQYIYNLATRPLPDPSATYEITITVPATGQKVTAKFGLRP